MNPLQKQSHWQLFLQNWWWLLEKSTKLLASGFHMFWNWVNFFGKGRDENPAFLNSQASKIWTFYFKVNWKHFVTFKIISIVSWLNATLAYQYHASFSLAWILMILINFLPFVLPGVHWMYQWCTYTYTSTVFIKLVFILEKLERCIQVGVLYIYYSLGSGCFPFLGNWCLFCSALCSGILL